MTTDEAMEAMKKEGTPFDVYVEKAPHRVKLYLQDPMIQEMERHILDRKTNEFIMIAVYADMGSTGGVTFHMAAAMAQGATEKEIVEVLFLTAYEQVKNKLALIGPSVSEGFKMGAQARERLGIAQGKLGTR